jgi:hypothetical protein
MLAFVASGRPGPVKGTFMTSTLKNSPFSVLPSTMTDTSIGLAFLSGFLKYVAPLAKIFGAFSLRLFVSDFQKLCEDADTEPFDKSGCAP